MQVTKLYRRGVVLPLDDDAEEGLRANDIERYTNVRVLEIADQVQFDDLWRLGLFHEINAQCGTIIDDYEEEIVDATQVKNVIVAIDRVRRKALAKDPEIASFLEQLRDLAGQAWLSSSPLLFML